jgi:signal transduction histidine kinase
MFSLPENSVGKSQTAARSVQSINTLMRQARNETRRERLCAKQTSRKDRLLAVLSHELRNPLAAMQRHFTSFKANSYLEAQKRRAFEIIDRRPKFIRDWLTICLM